MVWFSRYLIMFYSIHIIPQAPVPQNTCHDNPGAEGGSVLHLPNAVPPYSQGCHQLPEGMYNVHCIH